MGGGEEMPKGDAAKRRWELAEGVVVFTEKKMRSKEEDVNKAWEAYNALTKKKKKVESLRAVRDKTNSFIALRDEWERMKDISMSRWLAWQRIVNPHSIQT